jgi:hypothetical protein
MFMDRSGETRAAFIPRQATGSSKPCEKFQTPPFGKFQPQMDGMNADEEDKFGILSLELKNHQVSAR